MSGFRISHGRLCKLNWNGVCFAKSCGLKSIGACCRGKQRTLCMTAVVTEAVRLTKDAFRERLSLGIFEAAYRKAE